MTNEKKIERCKYAHNHFDGRCSCLQAGWDDDNKEQFKNSYKEHLPQLLELMKTYELAELGRDMWREQFKEIENRVLQRHEFFAAKDCGRGVNIHAGDRILSEEWTFLLSDKDINRLQNLMLPYYIEAKLTDERGYYLINWDIIVCNARSRLTDFIINKIAPESYREIIGKYRANVVFQEKLINIFKKSVA